MRTSGRTNGGVVVGGCSWLVLAGWFVLLWYLFVACSLLFAVSVSLLLVGGCLLFAAHAKIGHHLSKSHWHIRTWAFGNKWHQNPREIGWGNSVRHRLRSYEHVQGYNMLSAAVVWHAVPWATPTFVKGTL